MSRKGPRRKSQSQEGASSPTNSAATESSAEPSSSNPTKRKVTESEAVLTAKNYRLAKELVRWNFRIDLNSISLFKISSFLIRRHGRG